MFKIFIIMHRILLLDCEVLINLMYIGPCIIVIVEE